MNIEERLQIFLNKTPQIDPSAYVAPSAVVVGDVRIAKNASIWPTTVLRADINFIQIGEATNLQDGTVVHLADDYSVQVGDYVTVGHHATLHACTIQDECLIGMGATLLDGVVIGRESIIGAHALVTSKTNIPPGSLVMGAPAKVVRELSERERKNIRSWAEKYIHVAVAHKQKANTNI